MAKRHREVMSSVIDRILRGEFPAGGRLPKEQDLAAEYGVSRYVARECIQGLEDRGLVSVTHGKGTTVAPLSEWNLLDETVLGALLAGPEGAGVLGEAVECRLLLEGEAAALAAQRAAPEDAAEAAEALDRLRALGGRGRLEPFEAERHRRAEADFHRALVNAAGNRFVSRLLVPVGEAMIAAAPVPADRRATISQHERLLGAVTAGDPDGARAAARERIESVAGSPRRRRPIAGARSGR